MRASTTTDARISIPMSFLDVYNFAQPLSSDDPSLYPDIP